MTNNKLFNTLHVLLLWVILSIGSSYAQSVPLRLRNGAGTLRIGIICNGTSHWIDECNVTKDGNSYIIKNGTWNNGEVNVTILPLADTNGMIIELTGKKMPQGTNVCWAFGGCSGKDFAVNGSNIPAGECKDNVFCTEGNSFTTYYGEVMKLRTINGVMPWGEEMQLRDAHKQKSPLELINSDKKTDATVVSSVIKWQNTPLYFCLYQQNAKADYNYPMLHDIFHKAKKAK